MRAGCPPDGELFKAALDAAARAKDAREAERLYDGMRARGIRLDSVSAHYLLTALRAGGASSQKRASQISDQLKRLSIVPMAAGSSSNRR